MNSNSITLTIFGDICPVVDTLSGFESGNPQKILSDEVIKLISESDLTIGNLECVFTDTPHPIKKAGPVLFAPTKCLLTLSKAGFNAFSIANNHIRDCGSRGVDDTTQACKDLNIATFGGGHDEKSAKTPYIIDIKGRRFAFLSFAEHEFNAVGKNTSGAALLDVYEDFEKIRDLKTQVDHLIVLYHGGIEYHSYPSPLLQKKCRALARAGADVVLCQHSHCIGSVEKYGESTILYGQGNNLFGYRKNNPGWNNGLIVQVKSTEEQLAVEFIPCTTTSESIFELLSSKAAEDIISELNSRSSRINDEEFIVEQWEQFCTRAENLYLGLAYGWNRYLIFLNRKTRGNLLKMIYGLRKRNITQNLIRCESHHEVLRTVLDKYNFK